MRRVIAILLWLTASVVAPLAQPFRVVTWQVDRLPPAKAGVTNTPADEQRFSEVAATLSGTDADVIVLYGVADSDAARKISGLIKSKKYSVAHHAVFRHGGPRGTVAGQPVAILSRREKLAGKSVEWSYTGRIEMPGGFGFGVFRHGQTAVCLYVTTLPGSLTNGVSPADGKYFARKRNYAAQYLAHHAGWLATTFTNPLVATYLTGDFQLAPKGPVSDECARIFDTAGFRPLAPGTATDKTTTSITNSAELDRAQDPVFTKGIEFIASRQINRPPPEHPIVVCDLTFKPPGAAAKATIKPPVTRPAALKPVPVVPPDPLPSPAPELALETPPKAATPTSMAPAAGIPSPAVSASPAIAALGLASESPIPSAGDRRLLWWAGAGALGIAIVAWIARTAIADRRGPPRTLAEPMPAPLHLEFQTDSAKGLPGAAANASVLREASTATGQTDRVPWDRPTAKSESGNPRKRMAPHLRQLMRDVVIAWLTRQRTQLLESHERGTEQVLELHARVEKIRWHFQERMRSQQQRIAELDTALRSKEKIIVELIRARESGSGG